MRAVWICGAGTWQEVHEGRRAGSSIGFGRSLSTEKVGMEAIMKSHAISAELLYRFNGNALFLDLPSVEETRHLLKASGITDLAARLGVSISPEEIDWTQGGMRALETVATRLILVLQRKGLACQAKVSAAQPSEAASFRDHDW
jgi:hypothetical protein